MNNPSFFTPVDTSTPPRTQSREDESLRCPADVETATGHFDPAGYNADDCAGCGCAKGVHSTVAGGTRAKKERFYVDCEFDGHSGPLLSVAITKESGVGIHIRTDAVARDPWVVANVVPLMDYHHAAISVDVKLNAVGSAIRDFIGKCDHPIIVADSPVDIGRFCVALSTDANGGWASAGYPLMSFEVHNVDCYPTSLPGAVRHNAWWDAMALREKMVHSPPAECAATVMAALERELQGVKRQVDHFQSTETWPTEDGSTRPATLTERVYFLGVRADSLLKETRELRDKVSDLQSECNDADILLGLEWQDSVKAVHGDPEAARRHRIARLVADVAILSKALADAIRRPMGVIPDSAAGLITQEELDAAEARRVEAAKG